MLEDQVAYLLQKYLGNYVLGLSKEALKISVWQGDVELTNMQLKPEALNALKLPVKVKAGFLGSVKLKVPWSRIGQDPVLVSLDRIFLLAEPATQVEGSTEDAIQEAKKTRIREMEMKLLESKQILATEMNKSWLGSFINTIIGNLKLSISNIHIRYEDLESNPGHPFAAGVTLKKLSAVTVDDNGKETFITDGALDHIRKSLELQELAVYFDSDIKPWKISKPWKELLPFEWSQVFRNGTNNGEPADDLVRKHSYILQPVTGNANYSKQRPNESANSGQPLQKALVNLDDVTLCLSKTGYRDLLKLADNFAAFNQRLKYSHYRPLVSVKSDPRSWWRYAYKVISEQMKKASGKLSWDQVLRYASLRKKYISLYALLLKSDISRAVVDDNNDIQEMDRELDIELIIQWRMLAHKFVQQSVESDLYLKKQKANKSWWSFGWDSQSVKDENEPGYLTVEDWERLNNMIGYKEGDDPLSLASHDKGDVLHTLLEVHMKHNASKLTDEQECLAELSSDNLGCLIKFYSETKIFDLKLGSYQLSSPNGLLAESATAHDSLVGVFCYKPLDVEVDWSMIAKASPCYVTYLKDSVDQIVNFFESSAAVSQTIALETAAAVQMTIDEVKRTAQQQVNKAMKDHTRFLLDLDIAAPKITIPTDFCPDKTNSTKLLLDLGHLLIRTRDDSGRDSSNDSNMYLQFDLVLSDVSAFLVDGDYHWSQQLLNMSTVSSHSGSACFLPVVDKCRLIVNLQQIRLENPSYPSTRIAVRLPSLGFHFSPARYHRLLQVVKIFQPEDSDNADILRPWDQADFEGWLSLLSWKGVGSREAVWKRRYLCLVGPFLYVLEKPGSRSYKQYLSLRGKQLYQVPAEIVGNIEHVLAVCDIDKSNIKVVEDIHALILRCESEESRRTWQNRLQGAVYRASGSAPITSILETSSDSEDSEKAANKHYSMDISKMERVFITGVLDELKIRFDYNNQDKSFAKVLLAEESRLFEFRAIGGQVELSIRASEMFIGTVLKALELEDLVCYEGASLDQPLYLARSFIRSTDEPSIFSETPGQTESRMERNQSEGDDDFYEASESLNDPVDSPKPSLGNVSEYLSYQKSLPSERSILKPPNFSRIEGLLPDITPQTGYDHVDVTDTLDSFVKAQIVIYDQNSLQYDNIDKQVTVTLATLSFFCRRPMIVAIMEFVDAISVEDDTCESSSNSSSAATAQPENSTEDEVHNQQVASNDEPIVTGLLGKGKSRVMFFLALNMARAQILLMKEDGTKLATLSQDNFITDIKVFPSSFSIKASLGNLRISDDSLDTSHLYYWACDMRNPGGSSFVELAFSSFSSADEDYEGYDYSLLGQLSEVRVVYLNRFIQEIVNYFMGLVPNTTNDIVKVEDQVTNTEKWFTKSELEGSPAVKFDLSLRKPIILMPRRTDSLDYLKLDIVHITVQNTFQWSSDSKQDIDAVHVDILTVMVEDINLTVGTGTELSESILQDVKGVSIVIRRSLRDLLNQIPSTEVAIKIDKLKAALSNREYQIVSECAVENISETPNIIPPLKKGIVTPSNIVTEHVESQSLDDAGSESQRGSVWVTTKVTVVVGVVELTLHYGIASDASLATLQISGLWLLYKSNTLGEGFLSSTLKSFTVIDDREGTEQELRLAVRKSVSIGYTTSELLTDDDDNRTVEKNVLYENEIELVPTMLILDAKFSQYSTSVSLCLQRPQLLVALDFLLAVVEFFVPTVRSMVSREEDEGPTHIIDAILLDKPTHTQPLSEFSISPHRPLVVDDERYDHFIYDGNGGTLLLQDKRGSNISSPSAEAIIFVGNGKRLQFKNVYIKDGRYLDSCILMGSGSSYSVSEDDEVYLIEVDDNQCVNSSGDVTDGVPSQSNTVGRSTEFTIDLQAIGPELTFYNSSKNVNESLNLSNKLLHAQLDAFCRLVMKGNTVEMSASALGFTMESNGIRILEPFDTSLRFSNASGKTNIHATVSDIFMNFSFSILRLFLAVEDDILAFLRMTSKKMTVMCSEFDKIGTIRNPSTDQIYAFWRPHAPPGFAVLGDYLTPIDKPPTKGVLAVNTSFVRVKRPESFKLVWPLSSGDILDSEGGGNIEFTPNDVLCDGDQSCSVWFPEAPKGYVALGCVVSPGRSQPPLSSGFCVSASLVSPCSLRDCITISSRNLHTALHLAFWRVDNSAGTFLPADPTTLSIICRAYELRLSLFRYPELSSGSLERSYTQQSSIGRDRAVSSERSSTLNSGRRFESVASFQLIWWNQGSSARKKLSLWRPIVPHGMVYFGDIAVKGHEPPNTSIVLHGSEDEEFFRNPVDFQFVGQIKKTRGTEIISFWLPQPPPGYVSLGCVAFKGTPKQSDFISLRCMRSDMVTGGHFLEESIWDTSDSRFTKEPFSIWGVDNELGTFIARSGFKKPPRRLAVKLADSNLPSGSDDTVIDANIGTFSAALFDDYGGLMVPLFNISFSSIGFSLHGRPDYLNSTVSFSLAARSFNDKYETWEPLVEPVDGVLRYQYDLSSPGVPSQLRLTSTRDLNLNVTVSNANMIIQAYASWNNLSSAHDSLRKREAVSPRYGETPIINIHHKRNFYVIPQNKLGQDIFIRATEIRGLQNIIKMPSGEMKPLKVPVLKNMLDAHLKGIHCKKLRTMVTIMISEAVFPRAEGLSSSQYTVAVRLTLNRSHSTESPLNLQSARTCGTNSVISVSSELVLVNWNEIFFFKIESPDDYIVELIVTDMGRGDPVGYFSASLNHIIGTQDTLHHFDYKKALKWVEFSSLKSHEMGEGNILKKSYGRVKCAVLLSWGSGVENNEQGLNRSKRSGFIQISPTREGPWTTVRLNYAAPAACWRLGNDVVASEVSVINGNRYVNIRSLVSVCNNTEFTFDLCLKHKENDKDDDSNDVPSDGNEFRTDDFFEIERYNPATGWVSYAIEPNKDLLDDDGRSLQGTSGVQLPSGWEWIDDWHLDTTSVITDGAWVYAPDIESLKWPHSYDSEKFVNNARQRRWIRNRKSVSDVGKHQILVGPLVPGQTLPLPLSALMQSGSYILHMRPSKINKHSEYSWSSVIDKPGEPEVSNSSKNEICVSSLMESDELLYCSELSGTSSNSSRGLWFSLSIQASEIAKDIHSDSIQDWNLVINSPLSISNFLPLVAEYSVLEMQANGHFVDCARGVFGPGQTVKFYNADILKPLYFSLLPQKGWLPIHEAVLMSHPTKTATRAISLRSSASGRIVHIILEQNNNNGNPVLAKLIRIYSSNWFAIARCPHLTLRVIDTSSKSSTRRISVPFQSKKSTEVILHEISEEEINEGYTIAPALNFNLLGLSAAISQSGEEHFGPVTDLSPLGDMDGSTDLRAYDADGNCMLLFLSSKPCPYQSVPTKVISVRPYMTFTNRFGEDLHIKLSSEDEPKILHASDARVSFVHRESGGTSKFQVRMEDTEWSFPIQILKEDTISLVLRKHNGVRIFVRTEIRGYEEGSRFIVVFRLGSPTGPIRIENRTTSSKINFRQSGFGDDAWILLGPLSTTSFSWEDPYGEKLLETEIQSGISTIIWKLDLDKSAVCPTNDGQSQVSLRVVKMGDTQVARFVDDNTSAGIQRNFNMEGEMQENSAPLELIVELGVVGVSIVDHRPKELAFFCLERVFMSYSTGYDGGTTSRFKLILGYLQLDNQLPLTLMPVMLAPEQVSDINHPVFKMTITIRNENPDGIQVYPYVYIRVTDKCWRLNIHEPIIWAFVDFYNNLQLDRIPQTSSVTQIDPEIHINLIDVSEVRLKLAMETAPAQRPHGVLGVWSPILSAVGNAFKIQVHLRKVMHRDRFMRKSSVVPAIGNRVWRDLIHNPLHLIFSVDVLGMTSSTLASLSKGFAELSTDGQFMQLRSKQVWSRRITGVGDGILQGTEALAQGVAFGVSGVVKKPMESARDNGILGLAHGLGRAFIGFVVQPVSGALDFFSLTVDGIGASCSRCLEILNNKITLQRIRNPRLIRANNVLTEYSEREAVGQMILYLAEASRHFGCTELFKEPSKFAWSDYYEDHFVVPYRRIVLITNKRVMFLQCLAPDKMDKKPCKIMWDVPWEELMALELAKAGYSKPSYLILHLKTFRRSESFVRVIKCSVEETMEGTEPQAIRICSVVRKMWKLHQSDMKNLTLKVPSSQRYVRFAWNETDWSDSRNQNKANIKSRYLSLSGSVSDEQRSVQHSINFSKVWCSEQESRGRLYKKQVSEDSAICTIWRPICPEGYASVGDIARVGCHPPNVAAVYYKSNKHFAQPVGYDLVWRNCSDDYASPVSIWLPRAPEGYISLGCTATPSYDEPESNTIYCVLESLAEETVFEEQKVWSAPDSYPWACHIYQVRSDALHFVALRQPREESDWKAYRVLDQGPSERQSPG